MKIYLTGGSGLLGSHFAEIATAEGASIVSLVRPTSNTTYLESLGVTLSIGNLRDVASLASGMKDCDAVVHSASPLGGWGSLNYMRRIRLVASGTLSQRWKRVLLRL